MPAKTRFVQWFVASAIKGDLEVRASPLSMCVSVHLYTSGRGVRDGEEEGLWQHVSERWSEKGCCARDVDVGMPM
jgi:hypothetical protein